MPLEKVPIRKHKTNPTWPEDLIEMPEGFDERKTPKTSTRKDENDDADVVKKKARVAEIIAANKKKKKGLGKKSNVSGVGTVSPILSSYPSDSAAGATSAGFSLSDVPSVVWIVLAVAVGIFLIKSARKR